MDQRQRAIAVFSVQFIRGACVCGYLVKNKIVFFSTEPLASCAA